MKNTLPLLFVQYSSRLKIFAVVLATLVLFASTVVHAESNLDALKPVASKGKTLLTPKVEVRLESEIGRRVEANVENWLLTAPDANPGMLEMMRLRDREIPYEKPVPWAGEFIGKYLISAVQAIRMSDNPKLRPFVAKMFDELIATQAEDGYLGPFNKKERLLKYWDLWGHYHVMLALYKWHQDTGDQASLQAALKAADLICRTYLDKGKSVCDAGSLEMNMAIGHIMAMLYLETGRQQYLDMSQKVMTDWQQGGAGDYYRMAMNHVDFYRTPKPRWESLHCIESLHDLYLATGETSYRDALLFDWNSILKTDVHNSGAFSTGEGAIGNPFKPGAIETCCTVAWIAFGLDAIRLSGDSTIADELERSTWNAVLAYQHPSGRWSTYHTPMDGKREASAHSIVFQARPGTPELNCCSVNAPRGLGMITEWGLLTDDSGIYLNYYGPGRMSISSGEWSGWAFEQKTDYPADGKILLSVTPSEKAEATLYLRIPKWSTTSSVTLNGQPISGIEPGNYLPIKRAWSKNDRLEITFDMTPHVIVGDKYVEHRASLFCGPLLMVYDQKFNDFDPGQIPTLDLKTLNLKDVTPTPPSRFKPIRLLQAQSPDGRTIHLCDFATAGACGTYYQSWLPMQNVPPAAFTLTAPLYKCNVPKQPVELVWTSAGKDATYEVTIATDYDMQNVAFQQKGLAKTNLTVKPELAENRTVYWNVTASNEHGKSTTINGPQSYTVDPSLEVRSDGLLLKVDFNGTTDPQVGPKTTETNKISLTKDRFDRPNQAAAFEGEGSKLVYPLNPFPIKDYTATAWIRLDSPLSKANHQIFSAWSASLDDPLRLMVTDKEIQGIIEAQKTIKTPPVTLQIGKWYHVAFVKQANEIFVYLDGEEVAHNNQVPDVLNTTSRAIGIGCNPTYSGQTESFKGAIDQIRLYNRAFSPLQIRQMWEEDLKQ